jgi:dTMP kinase
LTEAIRNARPVRGQFITFEGGEGAGKSTQASLLAERLRKLGIGVELTREPGGSPGAEIIRYVLLSGAAKPLGAEIETMLFAAARDEHLNNTIRPALARGHWVICDRFADSTRVYQGALGEVDPRMIRALERLTVGRTKPSLTFILDLPPEIGLKRASKRRGQGQADRFEQENLAFHQKLREAFRKIAQEEPERCVLLDATEEPDYIADQIWRAVEERLSPSTAPVSIKTPHERSA